MYCLFCAHVVTPGKILVMVEELRHVASKRCLGASLTLWRLTATVVAAPLTSRCCILNNYSTNIHTEYFNPLPALTYQNVLDLNVACWAKRTGTYVNLNAHWKKKQLSCPCSRDLNWTGKGLTLGRSNLNPYCLGRKAAFFSEGI
jgi:hypothetical protein